MTESVEVVPNYQALFEGAINEVRQITAHINDPTDDNDMIHLMTQAIVQLNIAAQCMVTKEGIVTYRDAIFKFNQALQKFIRNGPSDFLS